MILSNAALSLPKIEMCLVRLQSPSRSNGTPQLDICYVSHARNLELVSNDLPWYAVHERNHILDRLTWTVEIIELRYSWSAQMISAHQAMYYITFFWKSLSFFQAIWGSTSVRLVISSLVIVISRAIQIQSPIFSGRNSTFEWLNSLRRIPRVTSLEFTTMKYKSCANYRLPQFTVDEILNINQSNPPHKWDIDERHYFILMWLHRKIFKNGKTRSLSLLFARFTSFLWFICNEKFIGTWIGIAIIFRQPNSERIKLRSLTNYCW